MREANQIVARTLQLLSESIEPGCTTMYLDGLAEKHCRRCGAEPAFKGYRGFRGSLCVSINEQVVHGIPSRKVVIRDGDIVSIDFGVKYKGYYGDSAVSLAVGKVDSRYSELLKVTREALYRGISQAIAGKRINDISMAVQGHVEQHGYSVVRQFVGHGIGSQLHEATGNSQLCQSRTVYRNCCLGWCSPLSPWSISVRMRLKCCASGWTVVTKDRKPSAHFEHSIAVTEGEPIILSELAV